MSELLLLKSSNSEKGKQKGKSRESDPSVPVQLSLLLELESVSESPPAVNPFGKQSLQTRLYNGLPDSLFKFVIASSLESNN